MNSIYYEANYGYHLATVDERKQSITYSLNEDDRLWFCEEDADRIENLLCKGLRIQYSRRSDKEFVELFMNSKTRRDTKASYNKVDTRTSITIVRYCVGICQPTTTG